MHQIELKEIEKATVLMAKNLMKDPRTVMLTHGLDNSQEILFYLAKKQLEVYMEKADVYVLGKCKGILIGYSSLRLPYLHYLMAERSISNAINKYVNKGDMKILIKNTKLISKVEDISWHKKASPTEQYYHIVTAFVDGNTDESEWYRTLMGPLMDNCDNNKVTIVTETFNES